MRDRSTVRLLILPLVGAVLTLSIFGVHVHLLFSPIPSSIQTYVNNLFSGRIASGIPNDTYMPGSFKDLQPGDIVLGGWKDCAYGLYSHAGIYAGNGLVLEALVDTGVTDMYVDHFMQYSHIAVIRIKASPEARQKAVDFVAARKGEMFFPLAFKNDNRYWNCTTILWKAYETQGVDLDVLGDLWISPENMKYSPEVDIIYDRNR